MAYFESSKITGNAGAVLDGPAGTPSSQAVTVQGNSGGTAIPVSGAFWQSTQPVSGTFWQTLQPTEDVAAEASLAELVAAIPTVTAPLPVSDLYAAKILNVLERILSRMEATARMMGSGLEAYESTDDNPTSLN